jgi:hypothetical protein
MYSVTPLDTTKMLAAQLALTLNPILNPQPYIPNPKPKTLNPKP